MADIQMEKAEYDELNEQLKRAYYDETIKYNNVIIKTLFRIGVVSTSNFSSIDKKIWKKL